METARMARILEFVLNGRRRVDAVPDNLLLLDYLREVVGLTGTKTGCDGGEGGACTVLVDDQPRLSCLTLAGGVNGQRVDTVESLGHDGRLSAVQRGFHEKLGSQCGYCTPGFIMASAGLLRRNPHPSEDDIRAAHRAIGLGILATGNHRLRGPFRVRRDLSFLCHLRVLYPLVLGSSTRGGRSQTSSQLLLLLETTSQTIVPALHRRARAVSVLPRVQSSRSRHRLLRVGRCASSVHVA